MSSGFVNSQIGRAFSLAVQSIMGCALGTPVISNSAVNAERVTSWRTIIFLLHDQSESYKIENYIGVDHILSGTGVNGDPPPEFYL